MLPPFAPRAAFRLAALTAAAAAAALGQAPAPKTFAELKAEGAARSSYRVRGTAPAAAAAPEPDLVGFHRDVAPILGRACHRCHGPDKQKADLRVDALDPDLFGGDDVDRWIDVLQVLTNGEMPPEDDGELADADRQRVVDWLANESQQASRARRGARTHSSFRRLSRYEYDHALQDLLGLRQDFADDLPPDPVSEDGFENSSEVLHLTGSQFRAYLDTAHRALELVTVTGERPEPLCWSVALQAAAAVEWRQQDAELEKVHEQHAGDPAKRDAERQRLQDAFRQRPQGTHYLDRASGRRARQSWGYDGAKYAWAPGTAGPAAPDAAAPPAAQVAVVPPRQSLIVELGDRVPERGALQVRVRAARAATDGEPPSVRLVFGWQASNDSQANVTISERDVVVDAPPDEPRCYEWRVPLSGIYPRNSVRGVAKLGDLPSPSEFLKIVNASLSGGDLVVEHVEVTAPVYESWPPPSHRRVFGDGAPGGDERERAGAVLAGFVPRAWRRAPTADELAAKLRLFDALRPACASFEQAMVEVLATVLASPNFLYVVGAGGGDAPADTGGRLTGPQLATRLSLFLWCSTPDDALRELAEHGRLEDPAVLAEQVGRLLADPRSRRFAEHFVRQWLHLQLLDFLHVDAKRYPHFDDELRAALREEPIAFFRELLQEDLSVLEFLHADFTMANERLARHYGLSGVTGNDFRRVALGPEQRRGGLLTQAGLLAMNSDGVDSHPLKRGVWMLARLLNDPPPPPPAAVPQIDLADPRIASMTLQERIANHRDAPACMSCHVKIDPWGIALESFDAVGGWRTEVDGRPVDAVGVLFNHQRLDGVDGLKRFLLEHRQDQFVRALVHKLTTFALGRPLGFADRAAIDEITAEVRAHRDGLATMVTRIATSALFRSR